MSGSETPRITGRIPVGPEEIRDELWVVDGKITFTPSTREPRSTSAPTQADLVVYPEDPRADVRVPAAPSLIVMRGRVVAGQGG